MSKENEEYKKGYRDGFKDGFEDGKKEQSKPVDLWNPNSFGPSVCYVCGKSYASSCFSYNCPNKYNINK